MDLPLRVKLLNNPKLVNRALKLTSTGYLLTSDEKLIYLFIDNFPASFRPIIFAN